ncbi:hypothetical protein Tco_1456897 [Tanacetum coccineum]
MPRKSFDTPVDNLYDVMVETLPTMVDKHIKEQVMKQVPEQVRNQVLVYVTEGLILERKKAKEETKRLIAKVILQERGNIQDQISTQIENAIANVIPSQVDASKTSEYEAYVSGESSSGQVFQEEQAPSTLERKFWTRRDKSVHFYKFLAVIFNDGDIEERTSRWVNKCVRKFNPYARYGVEHWKNPHAKIFYIRESERDWKTKEREIVARRANKYLVSITEPGYKNLNKNDDEDIYLLIMNGKVPDYADTGLLWSLSVFHFEECIYKNSKKEKRVMRHSEIHKFCDATLNRVLEVLKSYNNDIKYGYVQKDLTKDEAEYLKLFE